MIELPEPDLRQYQGYDCNWHQFHGDEVYYHNTHGYTKKDSSWPLRELYSSETVKRLIAEAVAAERDKWEADAARYRAIRTAVITDDEVFCDALADSEEPKTEAEHDAVFDAAIRASSKGGAECI